jgi:hypothetical protein
MKTLIYAVLAIIVLTMDCRPAIANQTGEPPMPTQPVFNSAQDFIEFFRRGEEYYDRRRLPVLMIGNQPDPKAVEALSEELLTGAEEVREKIIRLLDDIS